jgi:hypothetical protein
MAFLRYPCCLFTLLRCASDYAWRQLFQDLETKDARAVVQLLARHTLSRRDVVAQEAVWVAFVVRQFAGVKIHDVVLSRGGRAVKAGEVAHSVCDGVVRAGCVAADPEPADHLPVAIERDSAAECDDASRNLTHSRPLRLERRVERVRIVEPIEGAGREVCRRLRVGRLYERIEIGRRKSELAVAEVIRGAGLGDGDRAAAGPSVGIAANNRAKNALSVDHSRPHPIRLEQTSVPVRRLHHRRELGLQVSYDGARYVTAVSLAILGLGKNGR